MELSILHIADLHYDENSEYFKTQFKQFLDDLDRLKQECGINNIDIICFCGDLVKDGSNKEQFIKANNNFIKPLMKILKIKKSNFFICPGNHDMDRNKINKHTITIARQNNFKDHDKDLNNDVLKNYDHFISTYFNSRIKSKSTPYYNAYCLKINDNKIGIACLNSTLFSIGDSINDFGKLFIPENKIEDVVNFLSDCDFSVALLHHSVEWLINDNRIMVEAAIKKHFNLVLSGHLHEDKQHIIITPNDKALFHSCASLYIKTSKYDKYIGHSLIYINTDLDVISTYFREYYKIRMTYDKSLRLCSDGVYQCTYNTLAEITSEHYPSIFKSDSVASDWFTSFMNRYKPEKVSIIEYSSNYAKSYIEKLVRLRNVEIKLLICNPAYAINKEQSFRICQQIKELKKLKEEYDSLEIRCYNKPASIRGRNFDDKCLLIGWYTYNTDYKDDTRNINQEGIQLWGHNNPLLLATKKNNNLLLEYFNKIFDSYWNDSLLLDQVCIFHNGDSGCPRRSREYRIEAHIKDRKIFEQALEEFNISKKIKEISVSFYDSVKDCISGHSKNLELYPSLLNLTDYNCNSCILTMDYGGRNIRFSIVEISGIKYNIRKTNNIAIKQSLLSGSSNEWDIFDYIAKSIKEFIDENGCYDIKYLAVSFSFPIKNYDVNKAELIFWTKRVSAERVNASVDIMLSDKLKEYGLELKIVVIANNTISAFIAEHLNHNGKLKILSVCSRYGFNASYYESNSWYQETYIPPTIINLEAGNFNSDCFKVTLYDEQLDKKDHYGKGRQKFEKMIGGQYIAELIRIVICNFIERNYLFSGYIIPLNSIYMDYSLDIKTVCEMYKGNNGTVRSKLKNIWNIDIEVTDNDCECIKSIINAVIRRAGQLSAAILIGVLEKIDETIDEPLEEVVIVLDGFVSHEISIYKETIENVINIQFKNDKVRIVLSKDCEKVNTIGIAIAASRILVNN